MYGGKGMSTYLALSIINKEDFPLATVPITNKVGMHIPYCLFVLCASPHFKWLVTMGKGLEGVRSDQGFFFL